MEATLEVVDQAFQLLRLIPSEAREFYSHQKP
jgi:hypothetical protein